MAILPLPLIQEEQLSVNGERMCAKFWLFLGGLPRNSVDRITDRPDMTSAVDRGHKASTQTNKQNQLGMKVELFIDIKNNEVFRFKSHKPVIYPAHKCVMTQFKIISLVNVMHI